MKKYNLSKIMKRAWELVKKAGLCISEGLKLAWKEAKNMGETMEEKLIRLGYKVWENSKRYLHRRMQCSDTTSSIKSD